MPPMCVLLDWNHWQDPKAYYTTSHLLWAHMTRSTGINRHHGSHQTNFRCSKQILSKNIPHLVIYGLHIKSSLQSCLNNKIPFLSPPFFLSLNAYRCCFCTLLRRLHLGVSNYSPQCEFWVDQQWQPRVTTPFFFHHRPGTCNSFYI